MEFRHAELHRSDADTDALRKIYEELEFRTMASRLPAQEAETGMPQSRERRYSDRVTGISCKGPSAGDIRRQPGAIPRAHSSGKPQPKADPGKADISTTPHNYTLIETVEEAAGLAATLSALTDFCFDTETNSLDPLNAQLVSIAFSWEKGTGTMLWLPPDRDEALKLLEPLRPVFENEKIRKTGQNLKFDIQVLSGYGISIRGPLFDTMLAHYLLEPDMRHNMDLLASQYLGYEPVRIEELIGERGPRQRTMRDVEKEKVKEYAVEDADVTWQLMKLFEPMLRKEGLDTLAENIEMPLIQGTCRDGTRRGSY